jgi:hypothetical protein
MRAGGWKYAFASAFAAVLLAGTATPAPAVTIVDQAFDTPGVLIGVLNEGCTYLAQTFTAGVSGNLVMVSVDVESNEGAPPLWVAIKGTRHGRPSGDLLAHRYLHNPDAPLSRKITFNTPAPIVAGHLYAIVVRYRGEHAGAGHGLGSWAGDTDNGYPRGRFWAGDCPSYDFPRFWVGFPEWSTFDLHFYTYVDTAPS